MGNFYKAAANFFLASDLVSSLFFEVDWPQNYHLTLQGTQYYMLTQKHFYLTETMFRIGLRNFLG